MRNSNSQSKTTKTMHQDNNLTKTSTSNRNSNMENTNVNRPASGKRLESGKQLPPKGPIHKTQYKVQENMTESRISEAKQGLQLLKKKMSAKGMSRQKIPSSSQGNRNEQIMMKKAVTKVEEPQKMEAYKKMEKKNSEPEKYEYKSGKSKKVSQKNIEKYSNYSNKYEAENDPMMEAPIKPKKDFNAMLEQEMRKQKQGLSNNQSKKGYQMNEVDDEDIELVQCSMGCGRMFNTNTIHKHQKVCLKVFQSKRKAFNSAAHRAPETDATIPALNKTQNQPQKQKQMPKKEDKGKMPKWKQQSLAFRAGLKQSQGKPQTQEQKVFNKKLQEEMDTRVQCNFCGRKFEENAAKRHIAFCETKSKQMPKGPVKKKR